MTKIVHKAGSKQALAMQIANTCATGPVAQAMKAAAKSC